MYGGQYDPTVFLNKKRSEEVATLGWKYYHSGDIDTAIKRFNQAWMFDKNNPQAYWGFGLIMGMRSRTEDPMHHIDESIKYLDIARSKKPDDGILISDLAFSHKVKGDYLKREKLNNSDEIKIARMLFEEAKKFAPDHPPLYTNWAGLELNEGNCMESERLATKAMEKGMPMCDQYKKALSQCKEWSISKDKQAIQ